MSAGAGLIDPQGVVQQQHHRGAQRLGAGVGIGGGDPEQRPRGEAAERGTAEPRMVNAGTGVR